jgi:hypothetical protein
MHPILHRVVDAYRPLAGRNRLVEGPHGLPVVQPALPRRRMAWLALVAWLGMRP